MISAPQLRRLLVGTVGLVGFSVLMAAREELSSFFLRALVAGLAALVGVSAFLYVQRTSPSLRP